MKKQMLKYLNVGFLGLLLSFTTINAQAPEWKIDESHTSISFEVTHFFTPVQGSFKDFEGGLSFDPDNLKESTVDFKVVVASVTTNNEKRDNDLVSKSFFEADKFPEMNFKSSAFIKDDDGYSVKGKLTIKDVTKEVTVPFKVLGLGAHPMKKNKLNTAIRAEFTINRNDFGVGTGNWAATAVVGDEVNISVLLEANRNKD